MPILFQAVLLIGITCYFLSALLFDLTRDMPRLNPGIGWWALSSVAGGIGYFALLVYGSLGDKQTGEALYNVSLLLWSGFLFVGIRQWLGRLPYVHLLMSLLALATLVVVHYSFVSPSFFPAAMITSLCCGCMNLFMGWSLWRDQKQKNHRDWVLLVTFCISGLHWLDYPYLRGNENFAPLGFLLCAVASSTINIFLAAMVITQFKTRMLRSEQKAMDKAMHDPLTCLKNRRALDVAFEQSAEIAKLRNRQLALVFCDLDGFKKINDVYGHDAGDQVLIAISARISAIIRHHDVATRLGGDEFVILLGDLDPNNSDAQVRFVSRLLDSLAEPVSVDGHLHTVEVSIGVANYPKDGVALHDLLIQSDKSMYMDKSMKINRAVKLPNLYLHNSNEECEISV